MEDSLSYYTYRSPKVSCSGHIPCHRVFQPRTAQKEDTVNFILPHRIPLEGDPNSRLPVARRRTGKMVLEVCCLGSSTNPFPFPLHFWVAGQHHG